MNILITPDHVGRKVRLANGRIYTITYFSNCDEKYPVKINDGLWYQSNGVLCVPDGGMDDYRIVEILPEEMSDLQRRIMGIIIAYVNDDFIASSRRAADKIVEYLNEKNLLK